MPPRFPGSIAAAAFVCLAGCGYVGDPQPPSLNIPVRITDLAAYERGDRIVVEFTAPGDTTDGVGISRLGAVEIGIGLPADNWADGARRFDPGARAPGPVRFEIQAADWIGREVVIGARAAGRKGRFSEWSNLVRLRIVPPLAPPADLKAEAVAAGVRVLWRPPNGREGLTYRVFRQAESEQDAALLGAAPKPEYVDAGARFGVAYRYSVEAVEEAGDAPALSPRSQPVAITPKDEFPPAPPSGLAASAGIGAIELSWNPNSEPDLAGYYLYRAAPGGEFQRVGDLLRTPNYSDRAAESGKSYRYAVAAADQNGNESARSGAVEAAAP